jgi:hypothetical protein
MSFDTIVGKIRVIMKDHFIKVICHRPDGNTAVEFVEGNKLKEVKIDTLGRIHVTTDHGTVIFDFRIDQTVEMVPFNV